MKAIALIAIILLNGCATTEPTKEEIAWRNKILLEPMQRSYETPEQFEQRKTLEENINKDAQVKSAQKDKDMSVCRYEATKATASAQRGYTVYSTIFNDVGDTFRQAELIGLCMKSKGYAGS